MDKNGKIALSRGTINLLVRLNEKDSVDIKKMTTIQITKIPHSEKVTRVFFVSAIVREFNRPECFVNFSLNMLIFFTKFSDFVILGLTILGLRGTSQNDEKWLIPYSLALDLAYFSGPWPGTGVLLRRGPRQQS
jgi:hypothetical protein